MKILPNAVLCNVGILTTGFDCQTVGVIILYRAAKSLLADTNGRGAVHVLPIQKKSLQF